MTTIIQDQGLSISYGKRQILKGVQLQLQRGQRWVLTGPNGAGKSTYLRSFIDQSLVHAGTRHKQKNTRVELLPQASSVEVSVPCTVNDFIFYNTQTDGFKKNLQVNLSQTILHGLAQHLLAELSGGQLQRVLIFRALLAKADLLLLDEPFSSLDFHDRGELWSALDQDLATTCQVIVLHNPQDILQSRGRLLVISDGELREQSVEKYRQTQLEQLDVD